MNILLILKLVFKREVLLTYRKRTEYMNVLLFFVLIAALFPLAITPNPKILPLLGPGIIWISALLAMLLSLNKLFQADYRDGSLEQMLLSPYPLSILILAKIIAQCLVLTLPIILITPLLALMFHLPLKGLAVLMLSLLLGMPILSLLGSIMAALTIGLRNSGLLLALLLLPLYVPAMIFGSSAVLAADQGMVVSGQLAILAAFLVLSLTLMPSITAWVLRISVPLS